MSTRVRERPKPRRPQPSPTWNGISVHEVPDSLTRERIVTAAIGVADQDGLPAVSIRRVASELNASAMALYHYVPSKRDLLNLMLDATYDEFALPKENVADWRASLRHFAWESRRCLKRHPWISVLRANDPEYGPLCIETLEALLARLARFGFETRVAMRLIGTLFVFVNGFVAAEGVDPDCSQNKTRRRSAQQTPIFSKAILATGKYPNVARFIQMGAELPDDQAFERALNWMLAGIGTEIPSHTDSLQRLKLKQIG